MENEKKLTGRWGVGGNLESDSDKRPNRRGERGCGGSLAGTEFRSMFAVMRFSFRLLQALARENGHKVLLGPDEVRRWARNRPAYILVRSSAVLLRDARRGQIAGKTDGSVRCGFDGIWWQVEDRKPETKKISNTHELNHTPIKGVAAAFRR